MSKCPFWSTTSKKVECYNTCPLFDSSVDESDCVFKESVQLNRINIKGIDEEDLTYSQEKAFKLDFIDKKSIY